MFFWQNELSDSCKQMENDIQAYQRQLEAKKKMQDDLDKELQFAFQEISKLTALVDGKGTVQIFMSAHWPPGAYLQWLSTFPESRAC